MTSSTILTTANGVIIKVFVSPRSSTNKVMGEHNGAIKIALTAPPVEGAANKALVEFLAKLLGVPRSSVSLVSGETSRQKMVRALGVSVERAVEVLVGDGTAKTPGTPRIAPRK
ncbi:MAG TPA: DUF167 domain-containing protein [Chloroflexia bacterium]|jgi:hypothetical protein